MRKNPEHSSDLRQLALDVAAFWRAQRDLYHPHAAPLPNETRKLLQPFFSEDILHSTRYVERTRIQDPPASLIERVKKYALPPLVHEPSIAFIDVIIFLQGLSTKALFHSLVHVVQFGQVGVEAYFEMFIEALSNRGSYINVPFEVQAYGLDSRFSSFPSQAFSVESEVKTWAYEGRYRTVGSPAKR